MRAATLRVSVLPPVDTSKWGVRTLGTHVRDVRNMFLRTLGQAEESVAESVAAETAPPEVKREKAAKKASVKPAAKKKSSAGKTAPKKKAAAKAFKT